MPKMTKKELYWKRRAECARVELDTERNFLRRVQVDRDLYRDWFAKTFSWIVDCCAGQKIPSLPWLIKDMHELRGKALP